MTLSTAAGRRDKALTDHLSQPCARRPDFETPRLLSSTPTVVGLKKPPFLKLAMCSTFIGSGAIACLPPKRRYPGRKFAAKYLLLVASQRRLRYVTS